MPVQGHPAERILCGTLTKGNTCNDFLPTSIKNVLPFGTAPVKQHWAPGMDTMSFQVQNPTINNLELMNMELRDHSAE